MHKEIEEYLERSGLAWTHLRPTGFMQEYLREAPSIINDGVFYLALGDARLNPIDLVDVAKFASLLLRDGGHEGARIAITGPEALTTTIAYLPLRPNWWAVMWLRFLPLTSHRHLLRRQRPKRFPLSSRRVPIRSRWASSIVSVDPRVTLLVSALCTVSWDQSTWRCCMSFSLPPTQSHSSQIPAT